MIRKRTDRDPSAAPEPGTSTYAARCIDCPAARVGCFHALVGAKPGSSQSCQFARVSLPARAPLPLAWSERYAFALVRRGVLVRMCADAGGRAAAVDCAGTGAFVSLPGATETRELGYAATDLMVCLCPRDVAARMLVEDSDHARDVVWSMGAAIERLERLAFARAQPSAERRVASLLAAIADTMAPPQRRERLPHGLQQRDLARLAGVRHESFCRVLGELERRGLVRRDPDGLEILDHEGLAQAA